MHSEPRLTLSLTPSTGQSMHFSYHCAQSSTVTQCNVTCVSLSLSPSFAPCGIVHSTKTAKAAREGVKRKGGGAGEVVPGEQKSKK